MDKLRLNPYLFLPICVQVVKTRIKQGFLRRWTATVGKTASKALRGNTNRHYWLELAETRHNSRSQTQLKRDWFLDSEKSL
ncbi:hypothetical protein Cflav_PD0691 [Pedosphaera parvula Ellin514]|uniref:Uncharacterized protein n=1 Tax=Pedosphaera parvula (strain Ellin514) TaxID=320771 RepID=B9XR43_PEDPL|nr:hypothetical protein Cflav_PD0691 [Pedosphaera parvula Ellin514]